MKIRKILKLNKVAFQFDDFGGGKDEHYECKVIKDGDNITLFASYEIDNGLYCTDHPYSVKISKGELRRAIKNSERRSHQPENRTRKSVFVYPFTGKCKYCNKEITLESKNFDWGWCHPECEIDNYVSFMENYLEQESVC